MKTGWGSVWRVCGGGGRRLIFQWRIFNPIQSRPLQGGEGEGISNVAIDAIPHILKTMLNQ